MNVPYQARAKRVMSVNRIMDGAIVRRRLGWVWEFSRTAVRVSRCDESTEVENAQEIQSASAKMVVCDGKLVAARPGPASSLQARCPGLCCLLAPLINIQKYSRLAARLRL
jgi:hypothetical protein